MPRTPRNGFSSCGRSRYGTCLSPPMSSVRMISGRPLQGVDHRRGRPRTARPRVGGSSRSRNRNSVRIRPTPSAPASTACRASAGPAMFATTSTRWPSMRDGGLVARRVSASRSAAMSCCALCAAASRRRSGRARACRWRRRGPPSVPLGRRSTAGPAPTTAGMSERARDDRRVRRAAARPCRSPARAPGRARRCPTASGRRRPGSPGARAAGAPRRPSAARKRSTRWPTSRRSTARAASSGSSTFESSSARCSITSRHAHPGRLPAADPPRAPRAQVRIVEERLMRPEDRRLACA